MIRTTFLAKSNPRLVLILESRASHKKGQFNILILIVDVIYLDFRINVQLLEKLILY